MGKPIALMLLVLIVVASAHAAVDVPLRDLKAAVTAGFTVKSSCKPGQVTFAFTKAGEERRLLAAQGIPAGDPTGALAAEIAYEVTMGKGEAPRLAVIAWETDGGSWYKVAAVPVRLGQPASGRVSTAGLTQTAFSQDTSGQLEWDNVSSVWVGFIFDGAAEGTAMVTGARLTDTAVVPTQPVTLINLSGKWSDSHDPAVKTTISNPAEGPGGKVCFKYEYDVPAGRHMFACPGTAIIAEDLEGYKTLRFQLKSDIPQGMRLLIQMSEQGGPTYFIERPAPGPAEWTAMSFPLSEFKLATWGAKDDNGQLDLAKLSTISIGSHGVPVNARLGLIEVCEVEMVP